MGNGNGNSNGSGTGMMSGGNRGNRTDSKSSTSRGGGGGGGGGGGTQATTSTSASTRVSTTPVNHNSPFKIVDSHFGSNFFNVWNFWTFGYPTNGIVNYVDEATARANGLLEINPAGNAMMRVETTSQVSGNRRSVRIQTQLEKGPGSWTHFTFPPVVVLGRESQGPIPRYPHPNTNELITFLPARSGQTGPPGLPTVNSTSSKASTTTPPIKQPSKPTPTAPAPPPPPPPWASPEPSSPD
ncbi:hypothetical protein PQX77_020780 [Marasmius sp. AFHP31]|nr:hypothetical protein PQX77_020780 [Marasmius sp. AFHP31]